MFGDFEAKFFKNGIKSFMPMIVNSIDFLDKKAIEYYDKHLKCKLDPNFRETDVRLVLLINNNIIYATLFVFDTDNDVSRQIPFEDGRMAVPVKELVETLLKSIK